jgi:translation initiation factor 4G
VPTTEKPTVTVNFRKLLLNRCQKEFEKDKDDDEVFEKKQKEMDEAATVRKSTANSTPYSLTTLPNPGATLL